MNLLRILCCIWLTFAIAWSQAGDARAARVDVIRLTGPIGPVSVQHVSAAIERAEDDRSECLVIMLDTPGGLLETSQVPV